MRKRAAHGRIALVLTISTLMTAKHCSAELTLDWRQLPPLPDPTGFAGPFAGTSGGALIVAGGANFPDKMPWEGGRKVWYDTAYVLDRTNGAWRGAPGSAFAGSLGVGRQGNARIQTFRR